MSKHKIMDFRQKSPYNKTVWTLSLVSLFADLASEMLYPVMPGYLRGIGFSVLMIGFIEGFVSFFSGISKGYFGNLSDSTGRRLPFIRGGYFLSALSKPLLALGSLPLYILFIRTLDRLGKGLRTAPRDALLADASTPETRGRVFGLHRGMDTLGAALGPLFALFFLSQNPGSYKALFLIAFIPGIISVALLFILKEKRSSSSSARPHFFSYFGYWKRASPSYRRFVIPILVFALFNSADVFLILRMKEVSGSDTQTILAYVIYNIVYALAAFPAGALADRFNYRIILSTGFVLFSIVYFLFAFGNSTPWLIAGFVIYGFYAAATEGLIKAAISNLSNKEEKATALGFHASAESICLLMASILAGLIWASGGPSLTFSISAIVAIFTAIFIYTQKGKTNFSDG